MICSNCQDTKDVEMQSTRISEGHYVAFPLCVDRTECARRWNINNGLPVDFKFEVK